MDEGGPNGTRRPRKKNDVESVGHESGRGVHLCMNPCLYLDPDRHAPCDRIFFLERRTIPPMHSYCAHTGCTTFANSSSTSSPHEEVSGAPIFTSSAWRRQQPKMPCGRERAIKTYGAYPFMQAVDVVDMRPGAFWHAIACMLLPQNLCRHRRRDSRRGHPRACASVAAHKCSYV